MKPGQLNYLTGNPLSRRGDLRQDSDAFTKLLGSQDHIVVAVHQGRVLVRGEDPPQVVMLVGDQASRLLGDAPVPALLGESERRYHWMAAVDAESGAALEARHTARFVSLRSVAALLDRPAAAIAAHARALAHFHAEHAYCGRCGAATVPGGLGNWRTCSDESCARMLFPRTDPAIITRLARGDECLLVRQPEWRPRQYATVAGFVEPGESLEEAVAREVLEEVGLEAVEVGYHSSQPWPFPSGIMIGFDVKVRGEVSLEDPEIEDARWFDRTALRRARDDGEILLPSAFSISRRLIDDWLSAG